MATYRNDPRWISLKFSATIDGTNYPKGTRVFYYPLTKKMLVGDKAEQAARDFDAAQMDEAFNERI